MLIKNEIYTKDELEEINKELSTSIPTLAQQEKWDLINGFIKTIDIPRSLEKNIEEFKRYLELHNLIVDIINLLSFSKVSDKDILDELRYVRFKIRGVHKLITKSKNISLPPINLIITKEEKAERAELKEFGIFNDIHSKISDIFNGLQKTPIEKPTEEEVNNIIRDYNTLVDNIDLSDSDSKFRATTTSFRLRVAVELLSVEGINVTEQISTKYKKFCCVN